MNSTIIKMPSSITVQSSARLHMGFFDLHGGLGRKFGSIGLSLEEPKLVIEFRTAEVLDVFGGATLPATVISKAKSIMQQLFAGLHLKHSLELNILQSIPEHAGLGSGTQLALAIGAAVSQLYGLNLTTAKIAELTGRGGRSGIGIGAFDYGGVLIDGGRASVTGNAITTPPPLLARYDFPENWRILLIIDTSQPGIHGEQERMAFTQLPVFPENLAAHLCRQVLMQAMPALVEHDLTAFGHSIQALQAHVGDYFAPAQGGRYASKLVGEVLEHLGAIGVPCFGQSSWGPTGFAIFENANEAETQMQQLKEKFSDQALNWMISSACNHGAKLIDSQDS
ncbi:MAG: GHMP kinase [Methylotenera sp.]|nr:GHMP kinase [Methylotenera sp.]MDO9233565.1 GHMP kinase [Methylotenera sp.]MDO9388811.1 GHMP kinase [Methylotenera sp.]MDP2103138.1 GHMP kinase [Methylotenera sp.]MDP2281962.1 GHMP kinase [Methylotenera sp.]